MDILDVERGLLQMGRLSFDMARSHFPLLAERLGGITCANPAHSAKILFELLRELREELAVPELVKEMHRLIQLEPVSA